MSIFLKCVKNEFPIFYIIFSSFLTAHFSKRLFVLSVVDEALHFFTAHSELRVIVLNGLTANTIESLRTLRPLANSYTIISDTQNMERIFKKVSNNNQVSFNEQSCEQFIRFYLSP